ncbi:MAG: BON domain-containing protein [Thermomicrobiales bacterium]
MKQLIPFRFHREEERHSRAGTVWRRFWKVGAGGVAGAGLMYVLDPATGRRRRSQARDRSAGALRHSWRRMERAGRRGAAGGYGVYRKALFAWRPAEPAANDQMLTDRVLSIVYRDRAIPHGHLNVNVEDGVVVLRGQFDQPDDIQRVENDVRKVPGVKGVKSHLHLPETPAPNKQDARLA